MFPGSKISIYKAPTTKKKMLEMKLQKSLLENAQLEILANKLSLLSAGEVSPNSITPTTVGVIELGMVTS